MKRIFVFLFCVIYAVVCCYSQSAKEWVKRLDVIDISKLPKDNPFLFWETARASDSEYKQLLNGNTKRKKSYVTAENDIIKAIRGYEPEIRAAMSNLPPETDTLAWSLEKELRINDIRQQPEDIFLYDNLFIKIANIEQINACAFPNGNILLYKGLFTIPNMNRKDILAACAHELAHYMLKHALSQRYAYIKKQKSNKMWAEIGGGLVIAANTAASMYSISNGINVSDNSDYYAAMYQGMLEDAGESAKRFGFRYSRSEELQADILGCRYLQYLGIDDGHAFISLLEKLGTDDDKYYSKKSDHPKTEFRIKVIKALLEHDPTNN